MADYVGPIRRWQRTDTVPTNAEGGYAGADSVAAQLASIGDQAYAAQQTVNNLSGAATTLPPGSPATVTVTGSGTSKVINVGVPRGADGAPGMGYAEGQELLADSQAALAAAQQSATDADAAVLLAQQAQAAALEVPDANVSALVGNPATDTRAALDDYVAGGVTITLSSYASPSPTADHNAAINAALNAGASLATRRTVLVPPGQWNFTALEIPSGVTLQGAGGVLRFRDATTTNTGVAYYPIMFASGASRAGVVGVTIDMNSANNPSPVVCDAITSANNDDIRIEGNTILNSVDSGIMFSKVTRSSCSDNRIDGARDCGIYVNDGDGTAFSDNVIERNIISNALVSGIALKRITSKCVVANNIIYACPNGITLEQASTSTDYSTDLTITGNRIRGATGIAIGLRGSSHCVVSNNRISDARGRGIYVQGSTGSSIVGNVISHNPAGDTTYGIGIHVDQRAGWGPSRDVTVTGNVIEGPTAEGIYLQGDATYPNARIVVSSNSVKSGAKSALRVNATNSNIVISANALYGSTSPAPDVEIFSGATYVASGNALISGRTSGAWHQVTVSQTGNIQISNPDTYLWRLAAGIIGVQSVRANGQLRANMTGTAAILGNVGLGNVGLLLGDAAIYQGASGALSANGSLSLSGGFGVNGSPAVGKAANPGTASGSDAAVINALVTALRNVGIVA